MTTGTAELELTVRNLRRNYGDIVALDGVSLTVKPGDLHCLVGPNGSGKTTLFRIVLGLTDETGGTVDRPAATIGAGFQQPVVYPDLTVRENLDVFARLMDTPGREWREEVLDVLGLARVRNRRAGALSGGYAKKLDLALAMLKRPRFLLLDEPLADLDDVSQRELLAFLTDYADMGNAVLVSTHRIEDFATELDRLTVLSGGRIVLDESRSSLEERHRSVPALYSELFTPNSER